MSQLTVNTIQLGQSGTPANNFVLTVPSPQDGTIKLSRGNVGSTSADIMTVSAGGFVTFPGGGGGSVAQVVSGAVESGTTTATTTSFVDTTVTATITPTNASSKILIITNGEWYPYISGSGPTLFMSGRIVKNQPSADTVVRNYANYAFGVNWPSNFSGIHYSIITTFSTDSSPSVGVATTYKLQITGHPTNPGSAILRTGSGYMILAEVI